MLIVTTDQTDVYRNLALEEWLLEKAPSLPVLFLYVNEPCVVMGKNQNPWRECRLSLMAAEGVDLARRVSGGGAVYHDGGNLNISVIVPRIDYREEKQYELIFKTLEATFQFKGLSRMGQSSLAVNGKKFSGQAFCHRRDRTLHHGTLLVDADLSRLGRYLGPELDGIETKAIASVPAQVTNLNEVAPDLTVETLSAALIETFRGMYGSKGEVACWTDGMIPEEALLPIRDKISAKAWALEHTPRFQVMVKDQLLKVEKGRVVNMEGTPLFEEWLARG